MQDADFVVRLGAADELADSELPQAVGYLQRLLNDPHPDVREAAATALTAWERGE